MSLRVDACRTISPFRTQQNQGDGIFEMEVPKGADLMGNKEAARALLMVQKKLSAELSVEFKVNELLQQAMDPKNLALLFPGWQAWF